MSIKKVLRVWFLTAFMVIAAAGTALAGPEYVWLVNESSAGIDAVYITQVDEEKLGKDIMGKDVLYGGESIKINFNGEKNLRHCDFYIKLNNGDQAWIKDIDLYRVYKIVYTGNHNQPFKAYY